MLFVAHFIEVDTVTLQNLLSFPAELVVEMQSKATFFIHFHPAKKSSVTGAIIPTIVNLAFYHSTRIWKYNKYIVFAMLINIFGVACFLPPPLLPPFHEILDLPLVKCYRLKQTHLRYPVGPVHGITLFGLHLIFSSICKTRLPVFLGAIFMTRNLEDGVEDPFNFPNWSVFSTLPIQNARWIQINCLN